MGAPLAEIDMDLSDESVSSEQNVDKREEKLIIVTGFDIFVGHEVVNASWEAVRLLPDLLVSNGILYKIKKKLIKVEYNIVDEAVDEIWNENPVLVIHVGVHGQTRQILLEKLAYNFKFSRVDYAKKTLPQATACLQSNGNCCERICTKLDVKIISNKVNELRKKSITKVSKDVGNYLCGYIYLKSLDKNCDRTLFIHVPKIDQPYGSQEVSETIYQVIQQCIQQNSNQCNINDEENTI